MSQSICSVEGCENLTKARGWCGKHYMRWWTHGDPEAIKWAKTVEEYFWGYVEKSDRCWLWRGPVTEFGYGDLRFPGARERAHRFSATLHGVELIDGLVLDHLCRERLCVNPAHLEQVTIAENVRRGAPKGQGWLSVSRSIRVSGPDGCSL